MMEFIVWVIFTKIMSQVIIIKKIVIIKKILIIEKDRDYWKRLWEDKFSSNINEVIRPVLNFLLLFFFYDKISQVIKSAKRIKGTKKYKNTTNLRSINLKFIDIRFINWRFIRFAYLRTKPSTIKMLVLLN